MKKRGDSGFSKPEATKKARGTPRPWSQRDVAKLLSLYQAISSDGSPRWTELVQQFNAWARQVGTEQREREAIRTKIGRVGQPNPLRWTLEEDEWLLQRMIHVTKPKWNVIMNDMRHELGSLRSNEAIRKRYTVVMTRTFNSPPSTVTCAWSKEEDEALRRIGFSNSQLVTKFNAEMASKATGYYRSPDAVHRRIKRLKRNAEPASMQRETFLWTDEVMDEMRKIMMSGQRKERALALAKQLNIDVQAIRRRLNRMIESRVERGVDIPLHDEEDEGGGLMEEDIKLVPWLAIGPHPEVKAILGDLVDKVVRNATAQWLVDLSKHQMHPVCEEKEYPSQQESPNDEIVEITLEALMPTKQQCKTASEDDELKSEAPSPPPLVIAENAATMSSSRIDEDVEDMEITAHTREEEVGAVDVNVHPTWAYRFRISQNETEDDSVVLYEAALKREEFIVAHPTRWTAWIKIAGTLVASSARQHFIDWKESSRAALDNHFFLRVLFLQLTIDSNRDESILALFRYLSGVGVTCGVEDCCIEYDWTIPCYQPRVTCNHWRFHQEGHVSSEDGRRTLAGYRLYCFLLTLIEAKGAWKQIQRYRVPPQVKAKKIRVQPAQRLADLFPGAHVNAYLHMAVMSSVAMLVNPIDIDNVGGGEGKFSGSVGYLSLSDNEYARRWLAFLVTDGGYRWYMIVVDNGLPQGCQEVHWLPLEVFQQQLARMEGACNAKNDVIMQDLMSRARCMRKLPESFTNLPVPWSRFEESINAVNAGQREAIRLIVEQAGVLPVRGCFGCGKSSTLAAIARILSLNAYYRMQRTNQMLIVAESNTAIDACLEKLAGFHDTNPEFIVRLGRTEEKNLQRFSTESRIQQRAKHIMSRSPTTDERTALREARQEIPEVIRKAHIILSTFSWLGANVATNIRPLVVAIDEAGTVLEPSVLQVLYPSVRALAFFGDPKQLPPFTRATYASAIQREAIQSVLQSYERDWRGNWWGGTLNIQYRCHPQIGQICREYFYDYDIQHHAFRSREYLAYGSVIGASSQCGDRRVMYLRVEPGYPNKIEFGGDNREEAWNICECLLRISREIRGRESYKRVLVVTPYEVQLRRLKDMMKPMQHLWEAELSVKVASADSCQGSEANIMIMSFGWRNPRGHIGFMAGAASRLLVPISRPRDYMILVLHGPTFYRHHPKPLVDDHHWNPFLKRLEERDVHQHCDRRSWNEITERYFRFPAYYRYLSGWSG